MYSLELSKTTMKSITFLTCIILLVVGVERGASQEPSAIKNNNVEMELKNGTTGVETHCNKAVNSIKGHIYSFQHDDMTATRRTLMSIKILLNHGQYIGYPREDGSFLIGNLPADSYLVEVTHPKLIYEPARVDITSKGKLRARRVDYIQPSLVQLIDYPLKFRPKSLHNYFMPRETWRIMDLLFNPMVIMMVVPLVIIWLLPKMMNPQEAQPQRDSIQMPEYNVPELSEVMANMFGRGQGQASAGGSQATTAGGSSSSTSGAVGGRKIKKR